MKYSENDIDQFLASLKRVPENVDIKKVHQLLNHPGTLARIPETNSFNPLKIITMTSIIGIIIVLTSIYWPADKEVRTEQLNQPAPAKATPPALNQKKPQPELKESQVQQQQQSPANLGSPESKKQPVSLDEHQLPLKAQETTPPSQTVPTKNASNYACDWPQDTVVDGKSMQVTLTQDELEKLGFEFMQEDKKYGLFYHNNHHGSVVSLHKLNRREGESWLGSSSSPMNELFKRNEKTNPSAHDFYPLFETDFTMEPLGTPLIPQNEISAAKDTLIPVIIQKGLVNQAIAETTTLWFKTSDNFFIALPQRYSALNEKMACIKELRDGTGRTDIVSYVGKQIIATSEALELPGHILEEMGFSIGKERIGFTQTEFDNCEVNLYWGKEDHGVALGPTGKTIKNSGYKIVFISDQKGRQGVSWKCGSDPDRNKMSNDYFFEKHDLLIPVVLKQEKYPLILDQDQYLWFEPTPKLLATIPGDIGNQIREEYDYLVSDDKTNLVSSCTFFQACRATLHTHDLTIYPNPSIGQFSVTFSLPENETANFSISDLNGREVVQLRKNELLHEGQNQFQFDVSSLPSGMYLLVIHGNGGFISKRLIIQK